jgi:photosystem II stability/assembly factor-like uncharacterized protein
MRHPLDPMSPLTPVLLFALLLGPALTPPASLTAQTPEQVAGFANRLEWRELGPTIVGGRVSDLAVVESNPSTFYVGTASGGVWKTVNAGVTFEPVFEQESTASIGDVTVSAANPNVVWVGTGEPQNRQSSPWGNGVYRSTDAGLTWSHLGLEATHHIGRIVVHPDDPDVAYVAAAGHLWGANPERGVYRTTDGGRTWDHVLFLDENTGAIDLAMDPNDPRTLFAAMYQRQRKAWGFNGGGPGSGLYRTTDGGANWIELTDGLPAGDMGRIGVDIHRRDGRFVCAIVEADPRGPGVEETDEERNGVYCSTDRGLTWEHRSTTNNRPMYYSHIWIDPSDAQRIYLGGSDLFRTSDGGRTFSDEAAADVHPDHHALWIDPSNPDHLILGGDGGVSVSWDRSENWYQLRNLPIAQFYEIGLDMREPYHVCGGLQDNGSWCAPSDTWSNKGVRTRDWYNVGSGDGFFTVTHPTNTTVMFAESQGGNLTRVNLTTGERSRLRPIGRPGPDGDLPELRWNWNTPVMLSAHDENTVYVGSNFLFRSTDLGQTFEAISPDLSWAVDRDTLRIMGVPGGDPQMSRNDGQSNYGNITALAESPSDAAILFTGTDDGRIHVTRDGGASWTDVTGNIGGLPPYTYVTRLVASRSPASRVYAVFDGHRNDDFEPYVFMSDNFGGQWTRVTSGLPLTSVNALAEHPGNPNLLFLGNELGVYVSVNAGANWVRMDGGLPTVPVDDIEIHPRDNDLVIGTHGRGIWIMEDITPLERLSTEVLAASAYVFPIRRATSYNPYTPQGWTPGIYEAPNPEPGARIRYYLADDADEITLRVTDATGRPVRELEPSRNAGLNEVIWDLELVEADADGEPMSPGPRVLPGVYLVELATGADVVQAEVQVRLDPRVQMSPRELMVRHQTMLESYRLSGPVDDAEGALEAMGERLDEVAALLRSGDDADGVREELERLRTTITDLEEELDDASGGANVWAPIQGASAQPTADQLWQVERSWERVPGIIDRINALLEGDMQRLLASVYTEAARPDVADRVPTPRREG